MRVYLIDEDDEAKENAFHVSYLMNGSKVSSKNQVDLYAHERINTRNYLL